MDSIDKLLAELKTEYTEPKITPKQNNLTPVKLVLPVTKSDGLIDQLLANVQADFAEKDAAEELRKQEELVQEKIRQEKLQAKQREALEKPAKEWLAKLDPLSSEGLWFERFAEGYPDKLAAAIDYLQTNS